MWLDLINNSFDNFSWFFYSERVVSLELSFFFKSMIISNICKLNFQPFMKLAASFMKYDNIVFISLAFFWDKILLTKFPQRKTSTIERKKELVKNLSF